MFFVLSGFLITALLLEERSRNDNIQLVAFYMRRVLRLYPALVAATCLALILAALKMPIFDATSSSFYSTLRMAPYSLLYTANKESEKASLMAAKGPRHREQRRRGQGSGKREEAKGGQDE